MSGYRGIQMADSLPIQAKGEISRRADCREMIDGKA
jgi:hypothetical protein